MPEAEATERALVQIGLQQGLFTQAQVDDARQRAPGRPLAAALEELGVISKSERKGLERAAAYRTGRDEDKVLARIIAESGYCPESAVQQALRRQKDHYKETGRLLRLGPLLIEEGRLSDSQHVAARKIHRHDERWNQSHNQSTSQSGQSGQGRGW